MQNVKLEQNAGVYAPITFEEIVIVMTEVVIGSRNFKSASRLADFKITRAITP